MDEGGEVINRSSTEVPNVNTLMGVESCPSCGSALFYHGSCETLVGYLSPQGHSHDDNCIIHSFNCLKNGHRFIERMQRCCPKCEWKGKMECFCSRLGWEEVK